MPLEPLMDVALDPVVDVPLEPITGVLGATGALLGAVTLETLGFMLNPLTREILPMRMVLSHLRNSRLAVQTQPLI